MPKKPIDYSKTHFYKIISKDINQRCLYVGHTTDFVRRRSQHKQACNQPNHQHHDLFLYKYIRDNEGWDNWQMVLIDTHNCENRLHALQTEREYIDNLNATLNQMKPFTTAIEQKEKRKVWRDNNREKLNRQLNVINRRLRKEYPERFREYDRQKWIKHKDEIQKRQKQIIKCSCGICFQRTSKARHERSNFHQEYLKDQANKEHTEEFLQTTQDN